jgi:YidC/Oxa1 family membrane protein insertase
VLTLLAVAIGLAVVVAVYMRDVDGPATDDPAGGTPSAQLADQAGNETPDSPGAEDSGDTDPVEQADPEDTSPSDAQTPETPGEDAPPTDDPADPDGADTPTDPGGEDAVPPRYAARFAELPSGFETITLGALDDTDGYKLQVELSPYRAALLEVQLTDYFEHVGEEAHYTLVTPVAEADDEAGTPALGSYAARAVILNGQRVPLVMRNDAGDWLGGWEVVEQDAGSVTFKLVIVSNAGDTAEPVAEITRRLHIDPGSYSLQLDQSVRNLTDAPMTIQWEQFAQGDMTWDRGDYLRGRSRQYVLGYFNLEHDPGRFSISADDGYVPRHELIEKVAEGDWGSVWPNARINPEQKELAWLASVNRYFAVVTSAHADPGTEESSDIVALQAAYPTIQTRLIPSADEAPDVKADDRAVLFIITSREIKLAPGSTTEPADLGLDVFLGPRKQAVYDQPPYAAMRLTHLIRYSLGGMCGFCTFQWLAHGLMGLLQMFHFVLRDWGLAIILLVLVVRVCLHPLTKRGQINMMKMSKQMAAIQPEIAKLKKKYADNPQKVQQEQMKLFREKGINPAAGALGCMPMFLQMPIWIALYAMLYYAIELRHESAFYGVFQLFGNWHFLADLSRSDHFITFFNEPRTVNLLLITFDYSGINILPLLMAVTFYFNMKFTTPPPANEQQAQQQKIMRIMPFLFPIMLYSAPSGLTLYICASTAAGIIDSYIVRKHVKELEASGKLFEKKQPKPGGLMHRLQLAAAKAQEQAQQRAEAGPQGKNRGPQQFKKKRKR